MSHPFTRSPPPGRQLILAAILCAAMAPLAWRSTAAVAADMSTTPAAPAYQWTGCYAGLNGGGGAGASNFTTAVGQGAPTYLGPIDASAVSFDGSGSANSSNFLGGGQAGCNWQSGTVVVGLEADFDYFHDNVNFYNNNDTLPVLGVPFVIGQSLTTNYLATVRPRIGIGADRNLAYITGGVAFTDAHYIESYADQSVPPGIGSAAVSKFLTGWVAGAGWEYAWTAHWTIRFEYLFSSFGTTSALGTITETGVGSNQLHGSADVLIQVARAGMNFKF